jgi:hypothetical protein
MPGLNLCQNTDCPDWILCLKPVHDFCFLTFFLVRSSLRTPRINALYSLYGTTNEMQRFLHLVGYFSGEITNQMQPCNRIYYSLVHWRLNMFRAAHRPSSGALTVFVASGLHTHVVTGRSQVWVGTVSTQTWLRPVTTCVCKPEAVKTEPLMMNGVPLETCWAFNERWNNKFYYKVTSYWLFLLSHTAMHGSMSIKLFISINCSTCFRWFLHPSSGAQNCTYSVRYCQTSIATCCYRGLDGTIPDVCKVLCSWWWAEELPETCRAIYRNK